MGNEWGLMGLVVDGWFLCLPSVLGSTGGSVCMVLPQHKLAQERAQMSRYENGLGQGSALILLGFPLCRHPTHLVYHENWNCVCFPFSLWNPPDLVLLFCLVAKCLLCSLCSALRAGLWISHDSCWANFHACLRGGRWCCWGKVLSG